MARRVLLPSEYRMVLSSCPPGRCVKMSTEASGIELTWRVMLPSRAIRLVAERTDQSRHVQFCYPPGRLVLYSRVACQSVTDGRVMLPSKGDMASVVQDSPVW